MSEDDDPFENLGEPEDRDGDPFERLGEPESGDAGTTPGDESDARGPSDGADGDAEAASGFEEEFIQRDQPLGAHERGPDTDTETQTETDPGDPFSGRDGPDTESDPAHKQGPESTDDPFTGMEDREGDPFGGGESAFEAVDVDTVDEDEVWASLAEDATTRPRDAKRYAEVSKHRFCEQCEFFSEPPSAHCTHDEAEIVEYLDMETVRLLNCPIVAEQREIENDE